MGALHASGLSAEQGIGALAQQVTSQASTFAAVELFWLFGLVTLAMIPFIWLAKRSVAGGAAVAGD